MCPMKHLDVFDFVYMMSFNETLLFQRVLKYIS